MGGWRAAAIHAERCATHTTRRHTTHTLPLPNSASWELPTRCSQKVIGCRDSASTWRATGPSSLFFPATYLSLFILSHSLPQSSLLCLTETWLCRGDTLPPSLSIICFFFPPPRLFHLCVCGLFFCFFLLFFFVLLPLRCSALIGSVLGRWAAARYGLGCLSVLTRQHL